VRWVSKVSFSCQPVQHAGGCAPWHVFAALGVLHRHRSRPPPRSLPLPAAVAGVLRLMAKKRASPHDSKRKCVPPDGLTLTPGTHTLPPVMSGV
jgi:hypothetical protein